jgi:hypothetical protein
MLKSGYIEYFARMSAHCFVLQSQNKEFDYGGPGEIKTKCK